MYERYTQPARRAIFFAIWYSWVRESPNIDSVDLLRGVIHDDKSRTNAIFRLREYFPLYCGCPSKFATLAEVPRRDPVFSDEIKRILAWTAREAGSLGDYWIDTEHFLLGILRERGCLAGQFLGKAGLTVKSARCAVMENKGSRPDYGPIPASWSRESRRRRLLAMLGMRS